MTRALVTGGAGFIGAHLCRRLLSEGRRVVCMDNFVTGQRENIAGMLTDPHFRLREHDVRIPFGGEFDEIYHLACPASPIAYRSMPFFTMETCVVGTMNVLNAACGAKVLLTSTSEVYGEPVRSPQPETYRGNVSCTGPRACYDEGKRAAEAIMFDAWREYGAQVKVARIFNTYGPGMAENDGRVVSNFICQALRGEPLTVNGRGQQTRAFCYVEDMVDGLVRLMASPKEITGPINLGNPHEVTIYDLADMVLGLTRSSSRLAFRGMPVDDPTQRCPDIRCAERDLDWRPIVELHDGLQATVRYFGKRLDKRN